MDLKPSDHFTPNLHLDSTKTVLLASLHGQKVLKMFQMDQKNKNVYHTNIKLKYTSSAIDFRLKFAKIKTSPFKQTEQLAPKLR